MMDPIILSKDGIHLRPLTHETAEAKFLFIVTKSIARKRIWNQKKSELIELLPDSCL
jgi:hypothetical protein